MKSTKSYHESLLRSLEAAEEVVEYLNAALEEGDERLLMLALRNVAEANGVTFGDIEQSSPKPSLALNTLLNKLHLRFVIAAK